MKHIVIVSIAMLATVTYGSSTAVGHAQVTACSDIAIRAYIEKHKNSPKELEEMLIDMGSWKEPDLALAKELLTLGASATAHDPGSLFGGPIGHGNPGATAITEAAAHGHTDFVALLLDHGAGIETKSPWNGFTPLMNASMKCYNKAGNPTDTLQLLLNRGAQVNAQSNSCKQTALMLAAYYAQTKKVRLLLNAGADTTLQDESGRTAISMASSGTFSQYKRKYTKIAELLMFHNPVAQQTYATHQDLSTCTTEQLNDILAAAAQNGDLSKVKEVVAAGANPIEHAKSLSPLMRAVHGEHIEVAEYLLGLGAAVNTPDTTLGLSPFHLAVRKGNLPLIKMFVANGAKVKLRTGTIALTQYAKKPAYAEVLAYVLDLTDQV